eukprot:CAMPEP_0182438036 /NCGR_PEP_ID=MMETSP1167-20130531/85462_1 /TAXON_ID=2988 /ORGANISM="Mallomonas Sp, Strain CCMP3275" /LENGTH=175 /DNA_ID=CAMNT_0024631187 /DNA_START=76 /DNA_END=600 /DNA_ORIENTATION=+
MVRWIVSKIAFIAILQRASVLAGGSSLVKISEDKVQYVEATTGNNEDFVLDLSMKDAGNWIKVLSITNNVVDVNPGKGIINDIFISFSTGVIRYEISGVIYNYYKRLIPFEFDLYSNLAETWSSIHNIRGSNFRMHSTYSDVLNNRNPWLFCNYNDPGVGYPRDCGTVGVQGDRW